MDDIWSWICNCVVVVVLKIVVTRFLPRLCTSISRMSTGASDLSPIPWSDRCNMRNARNAFLQWIV
jgi:hypothetical protein